jgi:hypothetical protein
MSESIRDATARLNRDMRRAKRLLLAGLVSAAAIVTLAAILPRSVLAGRVLLALMAIAICSLIVALLLYVPAIWRRVGLSRPARMPGARVIQRGDHDGA